VQGRDAEAAATLRRHARELADAGAALLVLELVPAALAREVTAELPIPTIGIGAGSGCSGQVLVLHDMLGATRGRKPRFVRDFLSGAGGADAAIAAYVAEVKAGRYPDDSVHAF
jgi:3-methyl-2-oxobutanoate hydroxymethyltransferase